MIESIGLRDFRGIRLGKVEGLTSLNVLIGPNNSGKTALLEAMYLGCAVG
ncbi:MAG: AAA family ATPase, partial [Myxococcales bacterium]|nr:AAA family ATPase [Myxococcales bacterium]